VSWNIGSNPKSKGEYIVIDRMYGHMHVAHFRPEAGLGWCINGRWLGHAAVRCWLDPKELPPIPETKT
jgi:hypothetical protein